MEKIASREKYMNTQLEGHLTEYRAMQDQLAETKERYRQCSGGVTEKSRELAEVKKDRKVIFKFVKFWINPITIRCR